MLRGLIFDLGSTLLYHQYDHRWAEILPRMQADLWAHLRGQGYALEREAFITRLTEKFREFDRQRQTDWAEYTTTWLIQSTLREFGAPPLAPAAIAEARRAYYAYSETLWHPMPGLHPTLQALQQQGYRLAILSNASDDGNVQRLIDNAALRPYFDPIVISAAVGWRKPNPKAFEVVLQTWQLPPADCAMIGDTLGADILGAQLAGLTDIWLVSHADHPANVAHRGNIWPTHTLATLAELPQLLATLAQHG
jgi:putative hydrolase of the HAD superfamily